MIIGVIQAQLLIREKDLPGAIAVYQRALRLNPWIWHLHLGLAQVYRQTGQDAQALDQFDAVLEFRLVNAQQRKVIFVAEGEIKLKQGDLPGALVEFQKALELTPADAPLDEKIKRLQVQIEYQGQTEKKP